MAKLIRSLLFFVFFSISLCAIDTSLSPTLTINIPMRDGTELPTDIYLPEKEARNLPCILLRSPGGRNATAAKAFTFMANHGYVLAIQDTRCAIDPTGKTLPYCTDGWGHHQDGYDAVQWLAKSEFTNGKIGTLGASALGITQLLMAPTAPPALKCQYIGMAAANLYSDAIFPGGQFLKNQVEGWLSLYARDSEVLQYVRSSPIYNSFWKNFDTSRMADQVTVPAILYGGWYDIFVQGTIDAFESRHEKGGEGAKGQQKLIIGPWTHMWPLRQSLGDFEIPKAGAMPPQDVTPQRWFEHHLKGVDNGMASVPSVTYYVMGPLDNSPSKGNKWKTTEKWPIAAKVTPFYLSTNLTLSKDKPKKGDTLSYTYETNNPVPTIGGRTLFLEAGPKDQRVIEQRPDVLVFTTPELEEDLEVTGRILGKIFVSSDHPDTDIAIRLTDVYPDGKSILIADGLSRLAAQSEKSAEEQPHEIDVDLWSTSMVFAKGHRIRISVSSSNYPQFEKNDHGGVETSKVRNTLHLGGVTASTLFLPIVP